MPKLYRWVYISQATMSNFKLQCSEVLTATLNAFVTEEEYLICSTLPSRNVKLISLIAKSFGVTACKAQRIAMAPKEQCTVRKHEIN